MLSSEQPSINTSMVSLQNMPQSATVCLLKRSSCWIWWARSRRTMSYVMNRISWKVRLLFCNHEPCLMDLDSATFLRHRHLNPSGMWGCADQVISRPQVLHSTLLRSNPTSFKNCIAMASSEKRKMRDIVFGPRSSRSVGRPYDYFGTTDIVRSRSYSATTSQKR